MKIGILSFYPSWQDVSEEELRLRSAAESAGHVAEIIRADDCQLAMITGESALYYKGEPLQEFDLWIPRARIIGNAELHLALVKQLHFHGARLVNGYQAIVRAKNKLRTSQILTKHGLAIPNSLMISSPDNVDIAADKLGGFPLVMKDPYGTYGKGVVLVESLNSARSVLHALMGYYPKPVLMQEFVKESKGSDARIFVVGGKVIAAMQRQALEGDFRSNMELGGEASAYTPTTEEAELACAAARALDLEIAGVDIIQSSRGPLVLEVNANPGFKGLEATTGVDVAAEIVDYVSRSHV